jgi:hypothetical protein
MTVSLQYEEKAYSHKDYRRRTPFYICRCYLPPAHHCIGASVMLLLPSAHNHIGAPRVMFGQVRGREKWQLLLHPTTGAPPPPQGWRFNENFENRNFDLICKMVSCFSKMGFLVAYNLR